MLYPLTDRVRLVCDAGCISSPFLPSMKASLNANTDNDIIIKIT